MAARTQERTAPPPLAEEGVRVEGSPVDIDRTCTRCGKNDGEPVHTVVGASVTTQTATLPNGQTVQVGVPQDSVAHIECHALMGCDHCQEVLDAHDGSVAGKAHPERGLPNTHPDHVDIHPYEFEVVGSEGVLKRRATKAEARARHDAEMVEGNVENIGHDESHDLHLRHAAGEVN